MTDRGKYLEQFRDLTWFIELLRQGFEHLAQVGGYTDEQFRKMERALNQLEPVPDELDDLLVNLGLLPNGDRRRSLPLDRLPSHHRPRSHERGHLPAPSLTISPPRLQSLSITL